MYAIFKTVSPALPLHIRKCVYIQSYFRPKIIEFTKQALIVDNLIRIQLKIKYVITKCKNRNIYYKKGDNHDNVGLCLITKMHQSIKSSVLYTSMKNNHTTVTLEILFVNV